MAPRSSRDAAGDEADGDRKAPGPASPGSTSSERQSFPVVAVGGSAGSLPAFQELLSRLPIGARLALVIVSHQDPDRPTVLTEILAKSAQLPVTQVTEGERAVPGHVYVAPPGRYVGIREGVLHLEKSVERGHPPLPIDAFMRTLARDQGTSAVGIVVSGTGSDGTLGLGEIRSGSGLTLAQPPDRAEFGGMPGSAIAAGVVDLVLTPSEMAERLVVHAERFPVRSLPLAEAAPGPGELARILELVATHTGHDFSAYKRGTLQRRIERRLHLHGLKNLSEYLRFVTEHRDELDALWRDWLIGVSGFFRDPEAFRALESALLEMARERPEDSSFRVWVPGCATGQEAYSIAMLLLESAEKLRKRIEPQIFATDLDEAAIDVARTGRYPEGIAADVSPDRLRRFFMIDERHFVLKREVRERIVFATHDLLRDPPFTRMDLISCRNLLIYLHTEAQRRIFPLFHYSLSPGGMLFLGSSESTAGCEGLFSVVDRERKLFRRREAARAQYSPSELTVRLAGPIRARREEVSQTKGGRGDLGELVRRQLAERYAPPAVIVDEHGAVEHIHGRTGEFLEPSPGQPSLNVVDMARNGLRAPLASALREIARGDARTLEREARVRTNGGHRQVKLRVSRVGSAGLGRPLFLVTFEPLLQPEAPVAATAEPVASEATRERAAQLEEELRATREDHQSAIDQLQTANEGLASANEEVQSMNEELQSANEELQTSKEETQSLNEELQTVNAELQAKVSGLEQANDDLRNLIDSTGIAMVFADEQLRLKRFTPAARALIPLIASDIGRPLGDISTTLDYPDLLASAEEVLRTLIPSEREVRAEENWYAVQIRPYRTARNTIEGVSIAFLDITRTKRAELSAAAARALEDDILQAVREPLLVLDDELRVLRANRAFYRAFRVEPSEVEARGIFALGDGHWSIPRLRELLERILRESSSFDDFEVDHEFPRIGRRVMLLNARRIERAPPGGAKLILLAIEDVTYRVTAQTVGKA